MNSIDDEWSRYLNGDDNGTDIFNETDESNRYKKANIISVGNMVEVVKEGDSIYYDALAGHDIAYNDIMYKVIRARDIVIVE